VELKSAKITFLKGSGAKINGESVQAKVGDVLKENIEFETGTEPVTELTFEDGSVMRLGEKTKVSYVSKERTVRLEQGYMVFSTPEDQGGVTLAGGQATGKVSGSSVMGVRDAAGNFSFLVLESKGGGLVTGGSSGPTMLGFGEMTTIRAGGVEPPEIMDVHVDAVRDISPLFQQISTPLPGDKKVVATTLQQASDIQGDVKLLSSLEDYKLTENDPEGVALAMICAVGPNEMGAARNILLRPLDTAAGSELAAEQGSVVAVGSDSGPTDARQAEAESIIAASTPTAAGDSLAETDTAAGNEGGGGGGDTPPPLPPVNAKQTAPFTTPF